MSDPLISSRIKTDDILSLFWSFSSSFKTAKNVRIDRDLTSSPVCDNLRHLCHEIPFLVIFWSQLDRIHWIPKIKISILSHSWLIKHIRHFLNTFCTNEKGPKRPIWKVDQKLDHMFSTSPSYSKGWKTHLTSQWCTRTSFEKAQVAPRPFL